MIKENDYFRKFEGMEPEEGRELNPKASGKKRLLWIDENMVNDTPIGKSMKRAMSVMVAIPEEVEIEYVTHDEALDELTENCFLVILDHGIPGTRAGIHTLKHIRRSGRRVPVIYTGTLTIPDQGADTYYITRSTEKILQITDLPTRLAGLIAKYLKHYEGG